MSRRNSANRRRSYGRRLHEIHERRPRATGRLDWADEAADGGPASSAPDDISYAQRWPTADNRELRP